MSVDSSTMAKDPVCGKEVDTLRARAVGIFGGVTYYFCSAECKAKFQDPRKSPRESTQDLATRPVKKSGEHAKVAAATGGDGAPVASGDVKYARSKPRREPAVDPAAQAESLAELDELPKSGGGRAWIVVVLLFAVAGAVLFLAFR